MQAVGIEALRANIREVAPFLGDRVQELRDWNDVKILTVRADRLHKWYLAACCASEMRPTRCPQSAALGSIWPSRTLLQPPTSW